MGRPRRRTTAPPPSSEQLRRSVRLAKKARQRTPAVVAAQNVLLKKLGFAAEEPPTADDVDRYVQTFRDGLTEEQVKTIDELFVDHVPIDPDSVEEEPVV